MGETTRLDRRGVSWEWVGGDLGEGRGRGVGGSRIPVLVWVLVGVGARCFRHHIQVQVQVRTWPCWSSECVDHGHAGTVSVWIMAMLEQ